MPDLDGIKKEESIDNSLVKIYEIDEVESKEIPKRIAAIKDILGIENDDTILSILRHYNYNAENVKEKYIFAEDNVKEKLDIKIGLKFDKELNKKYPDITERLKENNQNMCNVMYMEFDDEDEEMKADELICGHQFSAMCWREYLKEKVGSNGPTCVFTTCP